VAPGCYNRLMVRWCGAVILVSLCAAALISREPGDTARLRHSSRSEKAGWIFVHLEGAPADIGYQHGYLLANEIRDAQTVVALLLERDTSQNWQFFRDTVRDVFWPKVPAEYREEIQGMSEGLAARGVKLDALDLAVMNAWIELSPYWFKWSEAQRGKSVPLSPAEHCSAFVATGSYTRDGRPVMGHNNWSGYLEGSRWNIVFDIHPRDGNRILMDGFPGLIDSADDFGINSAGIMITETTISQFSGFDPNGIPEFVRARKAMQYASSIDEFASIMKQGNNGGYANNWLVADRKTKEIASLELGLKNVTLQRTTDGYFVGSNFPVSQKLAREETDFRMQDYSNSANARHIRWDELMDQNKGQIDVILGQRFLSDHYDTYTRRMGPDERTLCGHIDLSPRGAQPWQPPYGPAGTVQAKVADATMAEMMSFSAAMGHPCGIHFKAARHLAAHPEFRWQGGLLRDLDAHGWAEFKAQP
jgi:hypothetical protein